MTNDRVLYACITHTRTHAHTLEHMQEQRQPHLASLAKVERLAPKGSLVNLAILSSAEGKTIMLQLNHGLGRLTAGCGFGGGV